jgi:hypothetical protein
MVLTECDPRFLLSVSSVVCCAHHLLRQVVRVDYKKRLVTVAKIYSYGVGYGGYGPTTYGNGHTQMSLDSDELRELSFSAAVQVAGEVRRCSQ